MIYVKAIEKADRTNKRLSSSSEEGAGVLNSSDEIGLNENVEWLLISERLAVAPNDIIAGAASMATAKGRGQVRDDVWPGCSKDVEIGQIEKEMQSNQRQQEYESPEERAFNIIKNAEMAKGKIFATKGNCEVDITNHFLHSAMADESYLLVASHLDSGTLAKIIQGDYVDFVKLIPRDRVLQEDESRLEMIIKGGKTFWVPVSETTAMSNFSKWEQAFHVYSDVYLRSQLSSFNIIILFIQPPFLTFAKTCIHMTKISGCISADIRQGAGESFCSRPGQCDSKTR